MIAADAGGTQGAMGQEHDEPKFTVKDRRRFSLEGDSPAAETTNEPAPVAEVQGSPPTAEPAGRPSRGRIDLASFVVSLATQAASLLGTEGEAAPDLDAVRDIVGVLEMLQDKTEGRRTPQESGILEDVLYQLRMAVIQAQRSSR